MSGGDWAAEAPWRVGRTVGRTIYAVTEGTDVLIGVMDSRGLAQDAVSSHNLALEVRRVLREQAAEA